MTKRILILLFAVMLTGMGEYEESNSKDGGDYAHGEDCDGGGDADAGYTARGGEYGHGSKHPPFKLPRIGVYVDGDTDNCTWMNSLDALDPVDQESTEE